MFSYLKKHPVISLLVIVAFLLHMLIIFPTGTYTCIKGICGYHFWGVHAHDAMWHLAVAAVAFESYPLTAPIFAGANLTGYNMLLDFVLFIFSKIGISPLLMLFKIIPLIWFILFTWVAITFARKIKDSPFFVGTLLFFFYFGSSFSYYFTLKKDHTILGSSSVLSMQALSSLTNIQLAISFVVILYLLIKLFEKKYDWKTINIFGFLVFLNIGFKFYGGVVSIFLAGLFLLDYLLTEKSVIGFIKRGLVISAYIVTAVLLFYNPFLAVKSGSILTFSPFSIVHPIIEEPTLFYMRDWVNARYFLYESHKLSFSLIKLEFYSLMLFLFFNLGVRFFGLVDFFFRLLMRKVTRFEVYIFLTILFSLSLTILFVQKGQWWNTIQFFYYTIFLSNFFIAQMIYRLTKKSLFFIPIVVILFLLNVPYNIDTVHGYAHLNPDYVSKEEVEALNVLKQQPKGVVFHSFEMKSNIKKPHADYVESAYVPAFSQKQSYLADLVQLDLTGIDYKNRHEKVKAYDCSVFKDVDYIYFLKLSNKEDYLRVCEPVVSSSFKIIFQNNTAIVYAKQK